ncbi:hypothetical protein JK635_07675 [Neobacillus sp. YIM B02564]|uniref:DNA topoisomerase (ATP-hydrolyzing) n=1 Tax=Neobacillus paridis TaxID=2803862 RepID=A0ABS1TLB5_9BACI|nr:DNA gyrase subunit A [Neobacillus paridis]MBL4952088.1 hypothetical protein [Neobacillus paridis]
MEIKERSFEQEMKESFLEYAKYVIQDRALPDARDGLKPVQRRILFAMHELGIDHTKPYKKSARIVGDTIGKYHPHGDSSVYQALVKMAQDFSYRYPLVDGHGNFGSIDGDAAAAMRYTEARMSPITSLLLENLQIVSEFVPNFDESLKEPAFLPSKLPNLLLNGSTGIAVGMSTTMIPHNAKEVLEALIKRLQNPTAPIESIIKGPDFPTGGVYVNPEEWPEIVKTGKGSITVCGAYHLEEEKDSTYIVFTELPYMVTKPKILEKLVALAEKTQEITDIRDESGRDGIRIVVETKEANPQSILHEILQKTPLQTNISVQNQVLVNNHPQIVGLGKLLDIFTEHRLKCLEKTFQHDLKKEEKKFHLLEGQVKALEKMDEVLSIIKKSQTKHLAVSSLVKNIGLSELQSEAILQMKLERLTSTEKKDLVAQCKESKKKMELLTCKLSHLKESLLEEWKTLLKEFGDPRRTKIEQQKTPSASANANSHENIFVVLDQNGMYRSSSPQTSGTWVKTTLGATLAAVDVLGTVYPVKVKNLPKFSSHKPKGLVFSEKILWMGESEGKTLIAVTKDGKTKQVPVKPGRSPLPFSKNADFVVDGEEELLILTKQNKAIRFKVSELPVQGKEAGGVRAIMLENGDEVAYVFSVREKDVLEMTTTKGTTKKKVADCPLTKRGGKGVKSFIPCQKERSTLVSAKLIPS